AVRGVVRQDVVVVVDAGLGGSDRVVLHEEFDELLAERRERADGFDHAGPKCRCGASGTVGRGAGSTTFYRLSPRSAPPLPAPRGARPGRPTPAGAARGAARRRGRARTDAGPAPGAPGNGQI